MVTDPGSQHVGVGASTPSQHGRAPAGQPAGPGAQHSNPPNAAVGAPDMGRPMQTSYAPLPQSAPEGPNKAVLAIVGAGLLVAAFGLVRSFIVKPEPPQPVVRGPSPWEQQQQLMRDAIATAREAQQLQREHQEQMRRAMEMDQGMYSSPSDW